MLQGSRYKGNCAKVMKYRGIVIGVITSLVMEVEERVLH